MQLPSVLLIYTRQYMKSLNSVQLRDAGTTGAVGAVAPVAFCTHNFTGAVRVHKEAATGAQEL